MMKKLLPILALVLTAGVVLLMPAVFVWAASPPQPSYGVATVDGNESEWDLTNDFFADMYRAAKPENKVESKLYLRYDCETATMYVLVLPVPGVLILTDQQDAYVKIDGVKKVNGETDNDGTPPDFAWIRPSGNVSDGWEASFYIAEGSYELNVHCNVQDNGMASQTSAVENRSIDLWIVCEEIGPGTAVHISASAAQVIPGETIDLNVCETNDGNVTLTEVFVNVSANGGYLDTCFLPDLAPGQTECCVIPDVVIEDECVTFEAYGYGTAPDGLVVSYANDPDEYDFDEVCPISTVLSLTVSAGEVFPGDPVILTILECNDGLVPLTDVYITLQPLGLVLDIDSMEYVGGDDGNDVLDPSECWEWQVTDYPTVATTYVATGHGLDPAGRDITFPDDPNEQAEEPVDIITTPTPPVVGGYLYPTDEGGNGNGISLLWIGLGLVLILAIGGGVLGLRRLRVH